MAWGFARLGHRTEKAEKLFAGVARELTQRTWHFKPQDVGTTMWSFATAEYGDYDAFCAGASRLNFRHIRSFKVCCIHHQRLFVDQSLLNLWMCLRLGFCEQPQEMSNSVWALATAGIVPKYIHAFDTTLVPTSKRPTRAMIQSDPITECFGAVASEIMRRPHEFKDQELKDVLWSFSKVRKHNNYLFRSLTCSRSTLPAQHINTDRSSPPRTFSYNCKARRWKKWANVLYFLISRPWKYGLGFCEASSA